MYPLLEIKNIYKKFGTIYALHGVSLSLQEGEILSLLGVNGAGKTTLSSIIATLKPPTSGDIIFKGKSIYKDIPAYRMQMSFCPQKPNLNAMLTLEDNLVFAGRYFCMAEKNIKERVAYLADRFGLETYLSRYAHELSGGYKQRFMIARSLMHSPALLILDEPTVALDPHIRNHVWEIIKEIKAMGTTVLLTTHYLDEAEVLSDRVCVLDKGTVRIIDTPANLMSAYHKERLEDVFIHLAQEEQ